MGWKKEDNVNQADKDRQTRIGRRAFIKSAGIGGAAVWGAGKLSGNRPGSVLVQSLGTDPGTMSPNEDLMQEHALLSRVLLIYEEAGRRLENAKPLDPDLLKRSAQIVRSFVEQYHEKLEEEHVFPRFEKAGKLRDLVAVLLEQHKAGRILTDSIVSLSTPATFVDPVAKKKLLGALRAFIRMYRPHASREGSVLFPAFRDLVPAAEFGALGDMFEKKEHEVLGAEGFEGQVQVVAGLEETLGIYALAQFTPK
jgi:hemerythrin-like domain-containing protein